MKPATEAKNNESLFYPYHPSATSRSSPSSSLGFTFQAQHMVDNSLRQSSIAKTLARSAVVVSSQVMKSLVGQGLFRISPPTYGIRVALDK